MILRFPCGPVSSWFRITKSRTPLMLRMECPGIVLLKRFIPRVLSIVFPIPSSLFSCINKEECVFPIDSSVFPWISNLFIAESVILVFLVEPHTEKQCLCKFSYSNSIRTCSPGENWIVRLVSRGCSALISA